MRTLKNNLSLAFSLIPYTLQKRMNSGFLIFFAATALVSDIASKGASWVGVYFFAVLVLYTSQFLHSVALAGVTQSSPKKRALLTDISTQLMSVSMIALFVLLLLLRLLYIAIGGANPSLAMITLLQYGLICFMLVIYDILVYRKPVIGYMLLIPLIAFVIGSGKVLVSYSELDNENIVLHMLGALPFMSNPIISAAIAFGLVVMDCMVFYIGNRLVYKLPLSEQGFRRAFRYASK